MQSFLADYPAYLHELQLHTLIYPGLDLCQSDFSEFQVIIL